MPISRTSLPVTKRCDEVGEGDQKGNRPNVAGHGIETAQPEERNTGEKNRHRHMRGRTLYRGAHQATAMYIEVSNRSVNLERVADQAQNSQGMRKHRGSSPVEGGGLANNAADSVGATSATQGNRYCAGKAGTLKHGQVGEPNRR